MLEKLMMIEELLGALLLMLVLYWYYYAGVLERQSRSYSHVKTIDKFSRCAGFKPNLEKRSEDWSNNGNTRYLYHFLSESNNGLNRKNKLPT